MKDKEPTIRAKRSIVSRERQHLWRQACSPVATRNQL